MRKNFSFYSAWAALFFTALGLCAFAESEKLEETLTPLSFQQSLEMALQTHETIQIAQYGNKVSALLPWRVIARFFPHVTSELSRNYPENEIKSGEFVVVPDPLDQASITLTQPLVELDLLPDYFKNKNQAQSVLRQSRFQIQSILFEVATAYFDYLKQEKLIKVNQEALKLSREQLRIAKERYDAGEVTKTDFLRSEVEATRANRNLMESINKSMVSRTRLASLIGQPNAFYRLEEPDESVAALKNETLENLLQVGSNSRYDLKGLQDEIEVARWEKARSKSVFLPTAELEVEQNWIDPESFGQQNNFHTFLFRLNFTPFEGGGRILDAITATYLYEQAKLRYERKKKEIYVQITQAWYAVKTTEENVNSIQKEVEFAEENYEVTSTRYQVGQATSLDLMDTFSALISAKTDFVNETFNYRFALITLYKESGLFAAKILEE